MGQALSAVASFADVGGEEEGDGQGTRTPPITDISEVAMRQSMRVKDWGKSRDLDLVWSKTDDSLEDLRDVTILPDESVAVSDPTRIRRFDLDGAEVTEYKGTNYRALIPSGVACSRDGQLLALCDHKYVKGVRLYNLQPPYRLNGERTKLFEAGVAIAVDPSSGLWVVAEGGELPCLNVLRDDGTRVRHFGGAHLKHPVAVAVDGMDRIYVTDSEQHCVCVFTMNGDFLFRFGSQGSGDQELYCPQGVCIDPSNNVYVADQGNDRLSVFSADGRLKFHLRTPKPLHQPRALALDEYSGRIAVTSKYMRWASLDVFVIKEIS